MNEPQSLLLCRLSALGDVVLTLPVLDAVRVRFPHARVEFLSRADCGGILHGHPALDALHLWPGRGHPLPRAVADRSWDVVLDLSATGRSRRLLRTVRAQWTARAPKSTLSRWAFVHLRRLGATGAGIPAAVDRMFAAASSLGLSRESRRPRFPGFPDAPAPQGPVLLAPGGGRATKCWSAARFAEIAGRLTAAGEGVRIVGTENERALLQEVAGGARAGSAEVFAGEELAALPKIVAACPLALTNDSALLHVAEAVGAAVIALFGPTHPRLGFAPLGSQSRILHAGETCSPCDPHGPSVCPRGHHRCMTEITVDEVWAALESTLREVRGT